MRTPFRLLSVLFALAAMGFGVLACGGEDSGSDKGVNEILAETFNGGQKVDSGRLTIGLSLDLQGLPGVSGPVTAKLAGPFETQKDEIPLFDLDLTVAASGQTFSAGATSVDGKGFLSLQGSDYAVPANVFAAFQQGFKQAQKAQKAGTGTTANPSLKSLGIDPTGWLKGAKKAGTEDVGGSETTHITADIDVRKMLADVNTLLERASKLGVTQQQQLPTQITPAQIEQIAAAVKSAKFEVFSGAKDNVLRRLVLDLDVAVPEASQQAAGGLKSAGVKLTLQIDDLNGDQDVKAPANPKPFEDLQAALSNLGVGALGAGTGATGAGTTPGSGGTAAPSGATGAGTDNAAAANAYLDCINAASDDAGRAACVAKLSQP